MALVFHDVQLEETFAGEFALETVGVSWKLNLIMAVVWMIRLLVGFRQCTPQTSLICSVVALLCASMSSLHQCCSVMSWYRVGWGIKEKGKAQFLLCDLAHCMALVLLVRGTKMSWPAIFDPALVFALHGWAIPFAGCRLIADIHMHVLNMFVLILLTIENAAHKSVVPSWPSMTMLVLVASILPLLVNIRFEAVCRKRFLLRRRQQRQSLGQFWSLFV